MKRRSSRRQSWARRHPVLAAVLVVLVLVAVGRWPVLLVFAGVFGLVTGGLWLLERRQRAVSRRGSALTWTAPRSASRFTTRARHNQWIAPASVPMTTVAMSQFCATGEHVFCPGTACGCPCGHRSEIITAMNAARWQAEQAAQPADTRPFGLPASDTIPF